MAGERVVRTQMPLFLFPVLKALRQLLFYFVLVCLRFVLFYWFGCSICFGLVILQVAFVS